MRKYQTLFSEDGDRYFLKYTSMTAENFNLKTQKTNVPVFEFATTNYRVGDSLKAIDPEKRLGYMAIFSMQENNYDDHFWDSYTSIEKDSSLKSQIKLHYSTHESKLINQFGSNYSKDYAVSNKKLEIRKKILQIAQKIHGGYGVNMNYYQPFKEQTFELIYQQLPVPTINYKPTRQIFLNYTFYTGFDLNRRMSIQTRTTHNLLKENYFYSSQLNFNRSYLVKKIGSPIVLKAILGIAAIKTGFYLGDIASTNIIKLDGQDLGYTTKAYLGEKTFNGVIGLELDFIRKRRHLFLTVQYNPIMWRGNALFFKTKKNIFSTKNATVTDFSGVVSVNNYSYRGVGNFSLTLGLGL